jgi:hypothetical protein
LTDISSAGIPVSLESQDESAVISVAGGWAEADEATGEFEGMTDTLSPDEATGSTEEDGLQAIANIPNSSDKPMRTIRVIQLNSLFD